MSVTGKKIFSDSSLLVGAEVARKIIRFSLVIIAARLLGDDGFGKFSFALAFTKLFLILADCGIHQLLVRELARGKVNVKKYVGNAFFIKIILCIITCISIYIIVNLTDKSRDVLLAVYILTLSQVFDSFSLLFRSVFQAYQKMKYDAWSTVITAALSTIFGIVVLLAGGGFIELAIMYSLASLINLFYCIAIMTKKFFPLKVRVDFNIIKYLLKEGLPFGVLLIFATIYTLIDTVMLSFMTGDDVVGWYKAAYQFVFCMMLIPMGTMKAVFPVLSKYYNKSLDDFKHLYKKLIKFLFIIGFSSAFILYIFSEDLILLVYGDQYLNGADALRILVWSTALIYLTTVMTHSTRASNRQRFTSVIVASGAVLNIILNFILIPRYQIIGAAYATLITEAVIFISHYFYLSSYLLRPPLIKSAGKIILINAVMIGVVLILNQWNFFILFFLSIVVNFGMILLVRYFSKNEINFILKIFKLKGGNKKLNER